MSSATKANVDTPLLLLRLLFAAIFVFMIVATIRTSQHMSIAIGGPELLRNPWGVMTLFDAYFGFLTFYVWVAYKETSVLARILWFVAIMTLGNIAMSAYVLIQLFRLPRGTALSSVLLRIGT